MPSALRVLQDHTVLQCRSLDRLYLNAYIPELQRPETVKRFLEREVTPIASPALFQARSDAFVKELHAYADGHGAPWIVFERGERKEDRMKPLFAGAEQRAPAGPRRGRRRPGADDRLEGHQAGPRPGRLHVRLLPGERLRQRVLLLSVGRRMGARSSSSAAMPRGAAGSGSTATSGPSASSPSAASATPASTTASGRSMTRRSSTSSPARSAPTTSGPSSPAGWPSCRSR